MAGALLRISTLCLALVISAESFSASADESTEGLPSLDDPAPVSTQMQPPPEAAPPAEVERTVPTGEIEAKAYDLETIRPSKSGKIYLFQKGDSEIPPEGKLVLLREGTTPVMALRVLKVYPEQQRFAAKKLRSYPGYDPLGRGSRFRAFEKLGDIVSVVRPTQEELNELKELEASPPETAPATPSATAPEEAPVAPTEEQAVTEAPPVESVIAEESREELATPEPPPEEVPAAETLPAEEPPAPEPPAVNETLAEAQESPEKLYTSQDDSLELKEEDEQDELDSYFPNQLTMEIGLLPSSNVPGPATKFGGGVRYGRKLSPAWLLEGTFYYYKTNSDGISLTVIPVMATLQWQTRLSSLWTGYFYGGFNYPYVASTVGASSRQLSEIQTLSLAGGAGLYLQTGPNWYLRLNLGVEAMSFGVMLRF